MRGLILGFVDGFAGTMDVDWDYWSPWYFRAWKVGNRVGNWGVWRHAD